MADDKTSESLLSKSLRLSGMAYIVGDLAMFASGMLEATKLTGNAQKGAHMEAAAGLLWGLGGIATAVYGNPKAETQLEILAHKLEKHLIEHGAHVSDATREKTTLLNGKHSLFNTIHRFLYEHPTEALNSVFGIGSVSLIAGGMAKNDKDKIGMGVLVLAGSLLGLLIKEDKDAVKKAEHGNVLQKVFAHVQEKPMRASSIMYAANNYFLYKSARKKQADFKEVSFDTGVKPHHLSFLTLTSYLFANAMLFLSPREQIKSTGFAREDVEKLQQVAAEIIGAQPKELQQTLLRDVSEFLAQEKSIPISADELAKQLETHVDDVRLRRGAEATARSWQTRHEAAKRAAEKHQEMKLR